jgi:hypothetical protein
MRSHLPDPNPSPSPLPSPDPNRDPDPTREPRREPDEPDVDVRSLPPNQPSPGIGVDNPERGEG